MPKIGETAYKDKSYWPSCQWHPAFLNKTLSYAACSGLRDDMEVFEVDKVTSRKTIERLLEEFGVISKG